MANALTIFEAGVPAHIAAAMAEEGATNIVPRTTVNTLTFDNSGFSINLDGKKTKLMKTNAEGEEEAVQIFTGIVLDYNKDRGREFYAKAYDPKNPTIPDCWSEDSQKPHANCQTPVSKTCASCPKSRKGSAHTADGRDTVACGQFQKLAVIPAAKIGQFPPLRMRLKITSIYDKSGQDSHPNWFAWQQYIDLLVSRGVSMTYALPTKVKFDKSVSYAKMLFAPGKDWLDDDTLAIVKEIARSDETKEVLASTYDPASSKTGNKPLPDDEEETELEASPAPAQAKAGKAAKPAAPAAIDDDDEDEAQAAPAKPAKAAAAATDDDDEDDAPAAPVKPAKAATTATTATAANTAAAQKATQKAAAAKAAAADDDDDDATTVAPPKAAKAATAAAPAKANGKAPVTPAKGTLQAPAEVASLMEDWDE